MTSHLHKLSACQAISREVTEVNEQQPLVVKAVPSMWNFSGN